MLPSKYLERGWTQCALARDYNGMPVNPRHQNAVAWCMNGAMLAALYDGEYTEDKQRQLRDQLHNMLGITDIEYYNDFTIRSHTDVIAIMKRAEQEMGLNDVA